MLYLVATPIGNLKDISLRAIEVLTTADVIIAEDTRHTGLLLQHYQISHRPMISLYDQIEGQKLEIILSEAQTKAVALVSDAGMPLICDPGYKLVRGALNRSIKVEVIPGPSAVLTALVASGLPPDKFTFWGFRDPQLDTPGTQIYFVSPHKLLKFLGLLNQEKEIVICRELTKIHEEIWRGSVSQAKEKFAKVKGELVILWHN